MSKLLEKYLDKANHIDLTLKNRAGKYERVITYSDAIRAFEKFINDQNKKNDHGNDDSELRGLQTAEFQVQKGSRTKK